MSLGSTTTPWRHLVCAFIICCHVMITLVHTQTISSDMYGTYGPQTQALDQGRISFIAWGTSATTGVLTITSWTSDDQTITGVTFGDATSGFNQCDPVALDSDDYILGYTVYFDDTYVYGMALYTYKGSTFTCYDSEVIVGKESSTMQPSEYYVDNTNFYYLSGWTVYHMDAILGIQLQFTNIATATAIVEALPDDAFACSSYYAPYDAPNAKYSSTAWMTATEDYDDWLTIDLQQPVFIESLGTMGSDEPGSNNPEWMTKYDFSYSLDGDSDYNYTTLSLTGNTDAETEVLHQFSEPLIARYIRIDNYEWFHWPAIRVEIYGYPYATAEYVAISVADSTTASATTAEPAEASRVDRVFAKFGYVVIVLSFSLIFLL